jgi:hypothetical protein
MIYYSRTCTWPPTSTLLFTTKSNSNGDDDNSLVSPDDNFRILTEEVRVTDVETFGGDSTTTIDSERPLLPGGEWAFAAAAFLAPEGTDDRRLVSIILSKL